MIHGRASRKIQTDSQLLSTFDISGNTRFILCRYGMACSKEPWILNRYIEYCFDAAYIRSQDSLITCLQYIADEEYGRDLVWAYMVGNWDMIVDRYSATFCP